MTQQGTSGELDLNKPTRQIRKENKEKTADSLQTVNVIKCINTVYKISVLSKCDYDYLYITHCISVNITERSLSWTVCKITIVFTPKASKLTWSQ